MVKWNWSFIRNTTDDKGQLSYKIFFNRMYDNGKFNDQSDILDEKLIILLSYLTLFPGKEVIKIKMRVKGTDKFLFFFLEKSYIKYGLVGCLAVEDMASESTFDSWGVEEAMATMVCGYYFDKVLQGNMLEINEVLEFRDWLDINIQVFYQEYSEKKESIKNIISTRDDATQTCRAYFESFSDAKVYIGGKNWDQMQEMISNPTFWLTINQKWEIQIINSTGIPLTDVLIYENHKRMDDDSQLNDSAYRNLDGMTFSVLQALVEEIYYNNLEIQYLKIVLPEKKGFSYVMFKTVNIGSKNLIILLSLINLDSVTGETVQAFSSLEQVALELMGSMLIQNKDKFTDACEFKDFESQNDIEHSIGAIVKSLKIEETYD